MTSRNPYATTDQDTGMASDTILDNTSPDTTDSATTTGSAGSATSARPPRLTGSARTQQKVGQAVEGAQETVGTVVEGAQEKVGQVVDQAKQQTASILSERKDQAADTIYTVAHALRQTGQQLREQEQTPVGQLADTAATQIERVSGYLHNRDVRQIVGEAEGFARQRPSLFIGGSVALGFLAARFLKSSRRRQEQNMASQASMALTPYPSPYPSAAAATPGGSAASDYAIPMPAPATTPGDAYDTVTSSGVYGTATAGVPSGSTGVRVSSDELTPPAVVTDASLYGTASSTYSGATSGAGASAYGTEALDGEDDARQAGGAAVDSTSRTTPGL